MNTTPELTTESRVAVGIKTAALVVILGLIAVLAQPTHVPDELFTHDAAAAPAPVSGSASDTTYYFPAQYPAPTTLAEQSLTF